MAKPHDVMTKERLTTTFMALAIAASMYAQAEPELKVKPSGRILFDAAFVDDRDGSITDVKVARSIDPSLDNEAVRVLSQMPKWKPGMMKGLPVRVLYTVPVTFKLQ